MMASQTKRKHSETLKVDELYDLCYNIWSSAKESFDGVRKWLHAYKDDTSRLKAAITYQGQYNDTPLHQIICKQPPLDIIQAIIKYEPGVLKMKDTDGRLPIHDACWNTASLEVIQALITASPDSIKVTDNDGWLSLHYACWNNDVSLDILNLMIISYPQGVDHKDKDGRTPLDLLKLKKYAEKEDKNGMLPLHHACKNGYCNHLICLLIQANPKIIQIKDNHGRTPLDYYTSFQGRQLCDEIIELLQPLNKRKSKNPVVSPDSERATAPYVEAPTVGQVENQPLPQMTQEDEAEIRNAEKNDMKAELKVPLATKEKACKNDTLADHNVSPASSSENFQTANPAVSHGNTSAAHSKKRSYQEIKKDFEESDAALLQARNEKNEQRILFFEIANKVLTKELESIQ